MNLKEKFKFRVSGQRLKRVFIVKKKFATYSPWRLLSKFGHMHLQNDLALNDFWVKRVFLFCCWWLSCLNNFRTLINIHILLIAYLWWRSPHLKNPDPNPFSELEKLIPKNPVPISDLKCSGQLDIIEPHPL